MDPKGILTGTQWIAQHNRIMYARQRNSEIRKRCAAKGRTPTIDDLVKVWELEEADNK